MKEKAVWWSKTVWVNVLTFVVAVLTLAIDTSWIAENPQIVGVLVSIIGAINVVLRIISSREIVFRSAQR